MIIHYRQVFWATAGNHKAPTGNRPELAVRYSGWLSAFMTLGFSNWHDMPPLMFILRERKISKDFSFIKTYSARLGGVKKSQIKIQTQN